MLNLLKITYPTLDEWKKKKSYIPLKAIKKLIALSKEEDIDKLENNVLSYKTQRGLEVKNPKIPIWDSSALREIVVHIMCDGCFSGGYAAYYNIDKKTKEEFINELKEAFGEIEYFLYEDHVHFPSAIALILKNFFNIEFHSKICRLPSKFYKGTEDNLLSILRAMIIDEGTIDGGNIRLDSCNKEFLEDIEIIGKSLGLKFGAMWESNYKGHKIFRLNISAESLKQLRNEMKPLPIEKKQNLIEIAIESQEKKWKYKLPGEIKREIVIELLKRPMKMSELIQKLRYSKTVIGGHIRWLIKRGVLDYRVLKNKRTYLMKDKEIAQKFVNNPSYLIKSEKINNYGLSQLKVLKLLNRTIKKYGEIKKLLGFSSGAFYKLIKSLEKKEMIIKLKSRGWASTNKGKQVLLLEENEARYFLYANIKDI